MADSQAKARRNASDKLRFEVAKCCVDNFSLHRAGADLLAANADFAAPNDRGCVEAVFKVEESDTGSGAVRNTWTVTVNADQPDERRGAHYGYTVVRTGLGNGVTGHVDLPSGVLLKYNRGQRPSEFNVRNACHPRSFGPGQQTRDKTQTHPTTYKVSGMGYFLNEVH